MARKKDAAAPATEPAPRKARQRKPRAAQAPAAAPPAPPPVAPPPGDGGRAWEDEIAHRLAPAAAAAGRLASSVQREEVGWYFSPFVPARCLTLVVGAPSCGKSSLGALLCTLSKRPAILPGNEEDIGCALVPRLAAAQVALERCLLLDGRSWSFPTDRAALQRALVAHGADLLWIDPIDTYVGECSENDGPGVRAALEALARVARESAITIIAARHPGKAAGNICPGSRQWRAVPREVIELRHERVPVTRRVVRALKDPYGRRAGAWTFTLEGEPGAPPRWTLGAAVSEEDADTVGACDAVEAYMVAEAGKLLSRLLKDGPQDSQWIYAECEKFRLHARTVRVAATRLGVKKVRGGFGKEHKCVWHLPDYSGRVADCVGDTPEED